MPLPTIPPGLPRATACRAGGGARRAGPVTRVPAGLLAVLLGALAASACATAKRGAEAEPPVRRVTADVAFEIMRDNPGLTVVDLREPEEFAGEPGQIRGARNLPLADLERRLEEMGGVRELVPVRDQTFLVYCRERDACGEEGMHRLLQAGYRNVLLLDGGIEAWRSAGYGLLGPSPPAAADATLGHLAPTHWRRLADGQLFEGGREAATGLFVPGRFSAERFVPAGGVEGTGEFCAGWLRRSPGSPRPGWLELRSGRFYPDTSPRDPEGPYVRGCLGTDGAFRPASREVR